MDAEDAQPDWSDHSLAGRFVVRVRRLADLSQRDLARRVGSSQSAIGRLEQGLTRVDLESFASVLSFAGLRLVVVDENGRSVRPVPADAVRDNQGRRFPAHLDVAPPDEVPRERWAFPRYDREPARGWYRHRARRDASAPTARAEAADSSSVAGRERPADHPTEAQLALRRRLMRGPQPRVSAAPGPDIECWCPDACFEELCVRECECQ
ncbi:hypothetical protein GCM10023258_04410 [Terrabacter aeriphilus]|uniref:HTH cro/C1-type domain-containing protein n=1 Tax=Terrabacter aeriphilus TaxID=515662 RepID=A0ABP9J1S5_9MICO